MATYKVIQDIEAEDKLVGPLSLRQFVYAGIGAFLVYLCVLVVMKGAAFLALAFAPPALFCFFFAWPWTPDQPTEVWALARIGFFFKPRRRIWDQSGAKELVTITVPKRIEKIYTNGLSQTEVKSRLSALADTIDSRGWVIKNSNINLSANAAYYGQAADDSDRLVSYDVMPQDVPSVDVLPADDILDEQNNPIAQQFDEMITASTKAHRKEIMEKLRDDAPQPQPAPSQAHAQNDYWFLHQEQAAGGQATPANDVVFANPQLVQPGTTQAYGPVAATPSADDAALTAQLKAQNDAQHVSYSHLKTIQPAGAVPQAPPRQPATPAIPVPDQPDPAILNLANNNDLNVATIAREAHKAHNPGASEDEVVISLH